MYGMVFEIEDHANEGEFSVYASFGGLIMKIRGKKAALANFKRDGADARIYVMIRKA